MSSESLQSSQTPSQLDSSAEIARLKRRLAASQEEVRELTEGKHKKPPSTVTLGRGIRRLVSLYNSLDDLLQAADDRNNAEDEEDGNIQLTQEAMEKQQEYCTMTESRFASFKILLQTLPAVGKAIEDPNVDIDTYLTQLQKGANDARSDDVRRIKEEVALWLNSEYAPNPPLNVKCRSDRGRQNELTARLLCPIEYDWGDEKIRDGIRAGTININEDYFLRCFYPHGKGDPDNVEKGFLRSGLLVKTYSNIFISPSSSESFDDEDENGAVRKKTRLNIESQKKATKSNVATILGMEGRVTPRSIAYAAVLLAFNLTDASHWVEVYNCFDYRALYALIVDFFEAPAGREAKKRSNDLLKWWSRQIFPHHTGASSNTRKSRNKLAAQRAACEKGSLA
ncbi:hypothetical protein BDN70DRAFT_901767 [Pholiota conissans]|uniref:Uncharacterized protein n=1 Tax=Pholiota conissans TaxID=109636 RepID=A0A9P6CLP5_9AGAR|nr:hypothetical protein BDN70DRAFT_901767 [Pholiota conissans]